MNRRLSAPSVCAWPRSFSTYRKFAQYPPGSRPAREHPDQLFPTAPVVRGHRFRWVVGRPSTSSLSCARIAWWSLAVSRLSWACAAKTAKRRPALLRRKAEISALPLSAPAAGAASPRKPVGPRPVEFVEDSRSEHRGELIATLRPADLALVDTTWPLRVDVTIKAGRDPVEQGAALFDFLFTPEPPAVSSGAVRNRGRRLADAELSPDRAAPGRYLLHVRSRRRERQKPLAYLESNSLLQTGPPAGAVYGLWQADPRREAGLPLKVRDFDGYLLKRDVDPDREQLPTRAGYHHTTQVYSLSAFSAASGRAKTRHEQGLKDVAQARWSRRPGADRLCATSRLEARLPTEAGVFPHDICSF